MILMDLLSEVGHILLPGLHILLPLSGSRIAVVALRIYGRGQHYQPCSQNHKGCQDSFHNH
jgi:hypothetical protein